MLPCMRADPTTAPLRNATVPGDSSTRGVWYAVGVALAAGMAALIGIFFPAFASAVAVWNESAAHQFSYLVIPVSIYFVWLRRDRLVQLLPMPDMRMAWLAVPCGIVWLVSHAAHIAIGVQFAAVGMVQVLLLTLLGRGVYRALLFPLMFLWLLVPFGESLIVPLMRLTSAMTVAGLTLVGFDAYAEGTVLIAEGARYLIVEECAALDFIIGNLVISLVYANLMYTRARKQWLYTLVSVPVAILANGLRTTSVVFITEVSDGRIGLAEDHAVYGWFLFLLAVACQMAAGWRYRDANDDSPASAAVPADRPSFSKVILAWCVAIGLSGAAPAYAAFTASAASARAAQLCWPELPTVDSLGSRESDWQPNFPNASGDLHVTVADPSAPVDFYVAYYWRERPGEELINWSNRMYDGRRWNFLSRGIDELDVDGERLAVNRESLRGPRYEERTVFYWYWVNGKLTRSAQVAKLWQAEAALLFGDRRAAVVALSVATDVVHARDAAQSVLDKTTSIAHALERVRTLEAGAGC